MKYMSKTRVRIFPITVSLSGGVDVGSFYAAIESMNASEDVKSYGQRHLIYSKIVNGLISLIILKLSDDKKVVVSRRDDVGRHRVVKSVLGDSDNGVEVILMIINPSTGYGLMYNYWRSTSPGMVFDILEKANNLARRRLIKPVREELKSHISNRERRDAEILRRFPKNFNFKIVPQSMALGDILARIEKFNRVVVKSEALPVQENQFFPNTAALTPRTIEYRVSEGRRAPVIQAIIDVVQAYQNSANSNVDISIDGVAFEGELMHLKLGDNLLALGELEFDDYVDELPKYYWETFYRCRAMKRLLGHYFANAGVFGDVPALGWRNASVYRAITLRL